jgi:NADH dehydrogenase FAD-containing subunit
VHVRGLCCRSPVGRAGSLSHSAAGLMASERKVPRVVVIGAGVTGYVVIQKLETYAKKGIFLLTVIDRKPYFENTVGALRSLVNPAFHQRTCKPHQKWVQKPTILIVGEVTLISEHSVTVKGLDGETIVNFDYVVLLMGSSYTPAKPLSVTLEERRAYLKNYSERVKQAKHILIVGGGPVGVEMLGEILYLYPDKEVTLVHSQARLLPQCPESVHHKLVSLIRKHKNAHIILNDRVELSNFDDQKDSLRTYQTVKGQLIEADVVVCAWGCAANSQPMRAMLSDALDAQGWVRVTPQLQVEGHPHMFAAGDIAATGELRLALNQKNHGDIVSTNLVALIEGKPLSARVQPEKAWTYPMITSFGPNDGVGVLPVTSSGWGLGGFFWGPIKTAVMTRLPY